MSTTAPSSIKIFKTLLPKVITFMAEYMALCDDDVVVLITPSHTEELDISLEKLSAPQRESEWDDEVDIEPLDSIDAREVESLLGEMHLHEVDVRGDTLPQLHRGCRDRDFPMECRMTPLLVMSSHKGEFFVSIKVEVLQDSPARRLQLYPQAVEWAAACTFRMETFSKRRAQVDFYSTCFAVSPSLVLTAEHCTPLVEDVYRITDVHPSTEEVFQNVKCEKVFLKKTFVGMTGPRMVDPVNDDPISAFDQSMDASALIIAKRSSRQLGLQKFEKFLLPMSLSQAVEQYGRDGALSIGVVGFPMCTEFVKRLRSPFNEDQEYFFDNYKASLKDWWIGLLEEMGIYGSLKDNKEKLEVAKQRLFNKIIEVLEATFMGFTTGQMLCSVGRLLRYNETTIAATYSWLSGGSGAALVSPDIKFSGVFFGIHMGPAECRQVGIDGGKIYPDHNLATSTDNPAFVKYFFKNVLPTLPDPSFFGVESERHRLTAFCSWLVLHLQLIISSKPEITFGEWSKEQSKWLCYVLEYLGSRKTLFGGFSEDDEEAARLGRKLSSLGPSLLQLGLVSDPKPFFVVPKSLEDLRTILEDRVGVKLFLEYIAETLKRQGASITAWGFPQECIIHDKYVLKKLALML